MENYRSIYTKSPDGPGWSTYKEHFLGRKFLKLVYTGDHAKLIVHTTKVSWKYLVSRYNQMETL